MQDPKPRKRTRDKQLLHRLHMEWRECCVCLGVFGITLHHYKRRSQGGDDVELNMVPLCMGPGTNDCHGKLHSGDAEVTQAVEEWQRSRVHLP